MLAAAKHQVFEQMCEPGFAGLLILGANVVPEVDGHDRRLMVLMHDQSQSVVEHEFLVRDIDVLGLGQPADREHNNRQETKCTHDGTPQNELDGRPNRW